MDFIKETRRTRFRFRPTRFINYIGDILIEIMEEKLKDGTLLDDK